MAFHFTLQSILPLQDCQDTGFAERVDAPRSAECASFRESQLYALYQGTAKAVPKRPSSGDGFRSR
jgi:hypothetical protein